MHSKAPVSQNVAGSIRVLGIFWVVYGIARLVMALWLTAFTPTATVMFGALLTRVPNPFSLMTAFHFIYLGIIIWSAACGVFGILAGFALLAGQSFAPMLAVAAAVLSLSELPLGTTLGIYTLILFLPQNLARQYVAVREAT
jgi:hypothetical protein